MNVFSLLEEVMEHGSELALDGDKLIVYRAKSLPCSLLKELKLNKDKILEALRNDKSAKESGFIVGISGLIYEFILDKQSRIYLELINNKWCAWRELYQIGKLDTTYVKTIETGNKFEYVLLKVKKYIDFHQNNSPFCLKNQ